MRGDYQRLHANPRPTHDHEWLAACAPAVGEVGKGRIVEALAQRTDFLGYGPEDKLVEGTRSQDALWIVGGNQTPLEF
jgi:hypothetical protein